MQTVKMSQGGRLVIPAALRAQLNIQPGDELMMEAQDGALMVTSKSQRIRQVRQQFQRALPTIATDRSVVDELLADRRTEVAQEKTSDLNNLKGKQTRHVKKS